MKSTSSPTTSTPSSASTGNTPCSSSAWAISAAPSRNI